MHLDDSIAATVVAVACSIGLLLNCTSIYITHKSKNFQNSFGIICVGVCIINSIVLLIIVCWTVTALIFDDLDESSTLAVICGQIANAMYYASVTTHTLIAFNRFCAIYFPTKYSRLFGRKEAIIGVIGICILTMLMTSGLYSEGCGYLFNAETYRWGYQNTNCGRIYQTCFNIVYTLLMLGTMTVVDLFTLHRLHHYNKQLKTKAMMSFQINEQKFITRKKELAFFVQSCICGSIYIISLIIFYVGPRFMPSKWGQFICITVVWIVAHALDGAVITAFSWKRLRDFD